MGIVVRCSIEEILDLGNVGTVDHLPIEKAGRCRAMFTFMPIPIAHCRRVGCLGINLPLANPLFCGSAWMWFRVPKGIKFNYTGKLPRTRYGPGCL